MGEDKEKVNDLELQALVDSELADDRLSAVANRVKESPLFQKRITELEHQKHILKLWWSSGKRTT